jgi:hypothetical protein
LQVKAYVVHGMNLAPARAENGFQALNVKDRQCPIGHIRRSPGRFVRVLAAARPY